jgi:hypothetical protein
MEAKGSFPLSHVPNNCSMLCRVDPVHVQTIHVTKISLNIILHICASVKQAVSLNQFSLPKLSTYDATGPTINTRINIFYIWPTFVQT